MGPSSGSVCILTTRLIELSICIHILVQRVRIMKVIKSVEVVPCVMMSPTTRRATVEVFDLASTRETSVYITADVTRRRFLIGSPSVVRYHMGLIGEFKHN
jgi:hypothetical protein